MEEERINPQKDQINPKNTRANKIEKNQDILIGANRNTGNNIINRSIENLSTIIDSTKFIKLNLAKYKNHKIWQNC